MRQYTVDFFIKRFEIISEDKWCIENYRENEKRCVLGHCGATISKLTKMSTALDNLTFRCLHKNIADINDGEAKGYKQKTPKQRVLAALKDIKKSL